MPTAFEALKAGRACLIATDTVYGLAALPGTKGYEDIFALKRRPARQVLPWFVSGPAALDEYGEDVPLYAYRFAERYWPGALTLVVKASSRSRNLGEVAEDGSIALRCPDNLACLELARELGAPIACTSANLHGEPAVCKLDQLSDAFASVDGHADLPPSCGGGRASTIVDCTGTAPRILREGPIPGQVLVGLACEDDKLSSCVSTKEGDTMKGLRIAVGSDHGGFEQKNQLRDWLVEQGCEVTDFGTDSEDSVDYPDYALPVAKDVVSGGADFGILVCGTGIGMQVAANKVHGIRAANAITVDFAKLAREHNNANVLTLSGRFVSLEDNKEIVETFLGTEFGGDRHARRVEKIMKIEQEG